MTEDEDGEASLPQTGSFDGEAGSVSVAQLQATIEALEAEVASLRRGLLTRELTGQAVGLLAAWLKISTGQAWEVLRTLSNQTNVRAREVARLLVASADGPVTDPSEQQLLHLIGAAIQTERTRRTLAAARTP